MLGLGLGLAKGNFISNFAKTLYRQYVVRVTAAGGVFQNAVCALNSLLGLNSQSLLKQASWVLVPDGIEEDVVFAQKPTSGLGDLTMTRASDATYTDSTGVVRRSPYNLLTWSEMFSDVAWAKTNTSITANVTNAPNGTLTADELFFTASSGLHLFGQVVSLNSGTAYTQTYFVKDNGQNFIQIYTAGTGMAFSHYVNFDLTTGTISASFGMSGTITNNGNGWYRISATKTAGANGTGLLGICSIPTSTSGYRPSYTASGLSIYVWGAQIVEGTEALDYFPTTNRQDVPRIDFRNADGTLSSCGRLLLEPQRTNSIRNSSMVGAVAGSPGTLPTNWAASTGLTQTIVGTGTENGLPYIDIRFNGTAISTGVSVRFETTTGIPAANAQSWTISSWLKFIAQPAAPLSTVFFIAERTSAGGFVTGGTSSAISVTSSLNRFSFTRTLAGGATVGAAQPEVSFNLTIGQSYDFTIRIAAPQMELGAYATTWVPTTTAAVTRLADFASKTGVSSLIGQSQGTLFVEVNDAVLGNVFSGTGRRFLTISDNTLNNRIIIFKNSSNDSIQFVVVSGGVEQASISTSTNQSGVKKIAAGYANNDFVLYVNGVQIGVDTSGAVPSCDRIALGYETTSNLSNPACPVAQAALFPTRLTNDQLEVLTSEGYGTYALLAQSLNCVLQ